MKVLTSKGKLIVADKAAAVADGSSLSNDEFTEEKFHEDMKKSNQKHSLRSKWELHYAGVICSARFKIASVEIPTKKRRKQTDMAKVDTDSNKSLLLSSSQLKDASEPTMMQQFRDIRNELMEKCEQLEREEAARQKESTDAIKEMGESFKKLLPVFEQHSKTLSIHTEILMEMFQNRQQNMSHGQGQYHGVGIGPMVTPRNSGIMGNGNGKHLLLPYNEFQETPRSSF